MTSSNVDQLRDVDYCHTTTRTGRKPGPSIALTQTAPETLDLQLLVNIPAAISCRLPPQLIIRLDRRCGLLGMKRTKFVKTALEGILDYMDGLDRTPRQAQK